MNPIRSILVHVDASPATAVRLQAAVHLAQMHEAVLTALYAATPSYVQYPYAFNVTPEIAPMLAECDSDRRDKAREMFELQARSFDHLQWADAGSADIQTVARAALCCDLLVLGQHAPGSDAAGYAGAAPEVPADFVEAVLLRSGKPAVVVPHIGMAAPIGDTAIVAWKETREAAHALVAAMPLLQRARQVHLVHWREGQDAAGSAGADPVTYLRLHGVHAIRHDEGSETRNVGEYLLSLASELSADLMVMGCYGHGRAREWLLGGASRTMLSSMTLPVLMAH